MTTDVADSSAVDRVARRGLSTAGEAARTWAWANPLVPVSLTVLAVASAFLHRRRRQTRVGDAIDTTLTTAGSLLDPPRSTSRWRLPAPLASIRHKVLSRITRGARARQS